MYMWLCEQHTTHEDPQLTQHTHAHTQLSYDEVEIHRLRTVEDMFSHPFNCGPKVVCVSVCMCALVYTCVCLCVCLCASVVYSVSPAFSHTLHQVSTTISLRYTHAHTHNYTHTHTHNHAHTHTHNHAHTHAHAQSVELQPGEFQMFLFHAGTCMSAYRHRLGPNSAFLCVLCGGVWATTTATINE